MRDYSLVLRPEEAEHQDERFALCHSAEAEEQKPYPQPTFSHHLQLQQEQITLSLLQNRSSQTCKHCSASANSLEIHPATRKSHLPRRVIPNHRKHEQSRPDRQALKAKNQHVLNQHRTIHPPILPAKEEENGRHLKILAPIANNPAQAPKRADPQLDLNKEAPIRPDKEGDVDQPAQEQPIPRRRAHLIPREQAGVPHQSLHLQLQEP